MAIKELVKMEMKEDTIEYAHKEIDSYYDMDKKKNVKKEVGFFELTISKSDKKCRYKYVNYEDGIAEEGEKDLAEIGWELMEALYRDFVYGTAGTGFEFQEVVEHLIIAPIYE